MFEAPSRLISHPVIQRGQDYVLALPTAVMAALLHQILRIVEAETDIKDFTAELHRSINTGIDLAMSRMDCIKAPTTVRNELGLREGESVYTPDVNKFIFSTCLSDQLDTFTDDLNSSWNTDSQIEKIETRIHEITDLLSQKYGKSAEVLILVVSQDLGRLAVMSWTVPDNTYRLTTMSVAELNIIAANEKGNPLALFQFDDHLAEFSSQAVLFAWTTLDKYQIYKSNRNSYYLSDESRFPDFAAFSVGTSLDLRMAYHRSREPVVGRTPAGDKDIYFPAFGSSSPLYLRAGISRDFIELELIDDGIFLPISSFIDRDKPGSEQHPDLVEMVAYWLWQIWKHTPLLRPHLLDLTEVTVDITGDSWEFYPDDDRSYTDSPAVHVVDTDGSLNIVIGDQLPRLGFQGKNQADRFLVEVIIRALIERQNDNSNAVDTRRITALVESVAPLGDKRKLNLIDTRMNPTLDPSWLPKYRHIQSSEVSAVSDHLGVQLARRDISGESEKSKDKVKVLNTSVEILFKDLNDLINEHNRTILLPWLMSQAEAILHEFRSAGLFAKQEIACFDDAPGVISRLMDRNSRATSANTSIRFLVELVGAGASNGTARPSLATLDRMMALTSEIINLGSMSDAIHYELRDPDIGVLGSGRLGYTDSVLNEAKSQFSRTWAREFTSRTQTYQDIPVNAHNEHRASEIFAEIDAAFYDELGISLSDLGSFIGKLYDRGVDQDSCVISIPAEEFRELLGSVTSKVDSDRLISKLFIEQRSDFFQPTNGTLTDTFPWRFNRDNSYIRRPLVKVPNRDGTLEYYLYGHRQIYESFQYLVSLVTDGRYKAVTKLVEQLIGKLRADVGAQFEFVVSSIAKSKSGTKVKQGVKKIDTQVIAVDNNELGDIDVLVAHPSKTTMFLIECKSLAMARTATEMATDLKKFVSGDQSTVTKHLRRTRWIEQHVGIVLEWLEIDDDPTDWDVVPVIVLEGVQVIPYLLKTEIPIALIGEYKDSNFSEFMQLLNTRRKV